MKPTPKSFLVAVTRTTWYRVTANDEDAAVDAYLDADEPEEIESNTSSMSAELDTEKE